MRAVGGYGGNIPFVLKTSELYSQSNGTWSASGSMNVPRTDFASVLLDNGQVLVAGGAIDNNGGCTNTAEVTTGGSSSIAKINAAKLVFASATI